MNDDIIWCCVGRFDFEGYVDDMVGIGEEVDVCLGFEEDDESF